MTGVTERFRILVLVLLAPLALVACATPRVLEISQAPANDIAGKVEIYVATTREPSAEPVYFSGERVTRLSFARLDITVPRDKSEGGTYVIPGHGRLADEADVVDYRDMATIVRDRVRDAINRKMSLEQVKAARLVRDYEGRFGASQGTWTTDAFIEAAYRSLSPAGPAAGAR